MTWESDQRDWINPKQFGFRKNSSCEEALLRITNIANKAIAEKKFCLVISLDISGAFDSTWHPGILDSLINLGCNPSYLKLMNNFLSNRTVTINIQEKSASKNLTKSCPQGEIHSPFLWNVSFNDIFDIDIDGEVQAFADDSNLIFISADPKALESAANDALIKINEWGHKNKLKFNNDKTEAIIFSNRNYVPFIRLLFNGKPVSIKKSIKSLGVILDSKLNFHEHVSTQCSKVKRIVFALNHYCSLKWGLNRNVIQQIWSSYAEQILLYAVPVWEKALTNKQCQRELESVQRLVAIKSIKAFRTVSYEAAMTLSKSKPILHRAHMRVLKYFIQHNAYCTASVYDLAEEYNINLTEYTSPIPVKDLQNPALIKDINITIKDKDTAVSDHIYNDKSYTRIFTDGSRDNVGTGAAAIIYLRDSDNYETPLLTRLRLANSIFQAEAWAIFSSLLEIYTKYLHDEAYKLLRIFSDSQSTLIALKNATQTSRLILSIKHLHHLLTDNGFSIEFFWSPGHCKIPGNETADYFAKLATTQNIPILNLPLPTSHLIQQMKETQNLSWINRWNNSDNGSITKLFIRDLKFISPNLTSSHETTQIITGHCRLNFFLQTRGLTKSSICKCGDDIETIHHFIYDCKNYEQLRYKLRYYSFVLGIAWPPQLNLLIENPVLCVQFLVYIKNTKRLSFD